MSVSHHNVILVNNFDFLIGSWNVHNRRLDKTFAGSDEWHEFPGISTGHTAFDGAGNFDEIVFPTLGTRGLTLRLFNPATKEWSLYWASSRDGLLTAPVIGAFGDDGRGEFFGDDLDDGHPVQVRFIWSEITPSSARWEQAYWDVAKRFWETNWIMELTRRSA
jgi:hypothetical protein